MSSASAEVGVHAEGDRQEDRDGAGAAEAGDQPDDQAGHDADGEHEEQGWVGQRRQRGQSGVSHDAS